MAIKILFKSIEKINLVFKFQKQKRYHKYYVLLEPYLYKQKKVKNNEQKKVIILK